MVRDTISVSLWLRAAWVKSDEISSGWSIIRPNMGFLFQQEADGFLAGRSSGASITMPSTTSNGYFLVSSAGAAGWQPVSRLNFNPCTGQVTRVPCSLPLLSEPPAWGQPSSMA